MFQIECLKSDIIFRESGPFVETSEYQVTDCWYIRTLVRVAVNTCTVLYPTSHQYIACIHSYCPCSRIANIRIPEPFFWGGGPKSVLFSLFRNKKA